jgi:hypothetical protein
MAPPLGQAPAIVPHRDPVWAFGGRGARRKPSEAPGVARTSGTPLASAAGEPPRAFGLRTPNEQPRRPSPVQAEGAAAAGACDMPPSSVLPHPPLGSPTAALQQRTPPRDNVPVPETLREEVFRSPSNKRQRERSLPKPRGMQPRVVSEELPPDANIGAPFTAPVLRNEPEPKRRSAPPLRSVAPPDNEEGIEARRQAVAAPRLAAPPALTPAPSATSAPLCEPRSPVLPRLLQTDSRPADQPAALASPRLCPVKPMPPSPRFEAMGERRVTVHIGTIEIRAPEQRRSAEQPVPQFKPPPAPAGFDAYVRLRAYAPWTS